MSAFLIRISAEISIRFDENTAFAFPLKITAFIFVPVLWIGCKSHTLENLISITVLVPFKHFSENIDAFVEVVNGAKQRKYKNT